jgi:hypothetical protein
VRNTSSCLCAAALAAAILAPRHAAAQQPNPILDLLGTIQKIAAGPAAVQQDAKLSPAGQAGVEDAPTDDIMRILASDSTYTATKFACSLNGDKGNEIALAQRTGKFLDAATRAKLQAKYVAACALNHKTTPIAQAKQQVGVLLGIAALNYHRAGMVIDDTVLDARHAIALLKLDAGANSQQIELIENAFWPKGPTVDTKIFAAMSALEAATKYQKNTFAFERTYIGKTLQIKGNVLNISGSDAHASIRLEGVKKEPDQRAWQDSVQCDIKDKDTMDAAARISRGDVVTVTGVARKGIVGGVTLADCRLSG